tara:strand:+ start:1019 stop:1648 length:630 start_codon:yes stop_codon:yes gene_type:complete
MKKLLAEDIIKKHKEKISALTKTHEEIVKQDKTARERQRILDDEIREAEALIEKHRTERHQLGHKLQLLARDSQINHRDRISLETLLEEDDFERRLQEECEKQPHFFSAVRPILETSVQECFEGLEGFGGDIDFDKTIEDIKSFLTGGGYSAPQVEANGFRSNYETSVRNLCERKMKGEVIPARELQHRITILRNFVMSPAIERFWNKR